MVIVAEIFICTHCTFMVDSLLCVLILNGNNKKIKCLIIILCDQLKIINLKYTSWIGNRVAKWSRIIEWNIKKMISSWSKVALLIARGSINVCNCSWKRNQFNVQVIQTKNYSSKCRLPL